MKAEVTCILKIKVFIIVGLAVLTSYSGQWEVFFTGKNDVRDIALAGSTLWAATDGGVVAWNLGDNSYKSYTTHDGLISCDINQVAIDKKGRPWVATQEPAGLFVYENNAWKRINVGGTENEIGDKLISGLEVDKFGNVWIYTRTDYKYTYEDKTGVYLYRYDGQTWYKHKGVYGPLALDPQKNLLAVDFESHENSTYDHQYRIVSYNGSEFVSKWNSKAHPQIWWIVFADIAQDSKGNIWVSYYDDRYGDTYGVVCNNTVYNTLDGLADDNVRCITPDDSGTVWCATDGGISKFTGDGWVTYDTTRGVASNLVYKILIDSNNTLYAATHKGISIMKSNQWRTLKTVNEPPHNNYTDMVIDKRDAVLLAGGDHIAICSGLQWKTTYFQNIYFGDSNYRNFPYCNNNKSFIKSKDGTFYAIGNEIGKYLTENKIEKGWILKQKADESTFIKAFSYTTEKKNRFMSPAVASTSNDTCFWLTDVDGNLILLKKQAVTIFPPSKFGIRKKKPSITCMLPDRDGRSVWIGYGSGGIVHFDGDTVKKRINMDDGLASNCMNAIARDSSDNLWFASKGGVTVLRNMKLTTYLNDSDGKVIGGCNALFVDKLGIVWMHSDNGIERFDGSSWKLFDSTEVSPDLPYAHYSHIIQDKSGTVWFGTCGSGLLAYKDNRWNQFTTRDGIPHNNILSCAVDSNDNIWILTDNGIAMRRSDGKVYNRARRDFLNPGDKLEVKQCGSRFYFSWNNKPEIIRYTLFDLRGRVVHRQTIHSRKSFMLPENDFGSGLRILSITLEDSDGSQNKYLLKMGDIQ